MSNRTLIPALSANVGDWKYYICVMKYAQVAKEIQFAHDLGGNTELSNLIQRGISERTKEIVQYLLHSPHRFLGALIVAAWGGDPNYISVEMQNDEGLLHGLDNSFGVLTFDGSHQYFALDGQHRLRAIKDAIKQNPELGKEEICVILVSHFDTPEGQEKTRRLFTNINKNAKSTTKGENIALDEDNGFAILTRRLIDYHPFLKQDGRVIVFTRNNEEGDISIAGGNIPNTNKRAFTTISTLFEMLQSLGHELDASMDKKLSHRPTDDVLEDSYKILEKRVNDILINCGDIQNKFQNLTSAAQLRCPKGKEGDGHPFMRSLVQRAVTRCIEKVMDQKSLTWNETMKRFSSLDWKLSGSPWNSVVNLKENKVKMITSRENVSLLDDLLIAHIAPNSKSEIKRALTKFKDLRGCKYPIPEDDLYKNIVKFDEPQMNKADGIAN